jgi:hypothetical protein
MQVMTEARSHPVIYAPGHAVIGAAATERGAIAHARNIPKLACERWAASLRSRLDGSLAWFVGPVLAERGQGCCRRS